MYAGEMGKTLRGAVRPWRATEGAEPYTMKVVRAVLNGGREETCSEETCSNVTRLAPTQLPRSGFRARLKPGVRRRELLEDDWLPLVQRHVHFVWLL